MDAEAAAAAAAAPTKLAIGVEGGFSVDDADKYDIVKEHALVIMPAGARVPYPNSELPTIVSNSIDAVLAHAGFNEHEEVAAWQEEIKAGRLLRTSTRPTLNLLNLLLLLHVFI